MEELNEKLQSIEVLLQANIAKMNKIVAEANDPEKKAKEAQILIEAAKSINSATNSIKGLITSETALIEGFNPKVEVKQTTLNVTVNKPLAWILGAAFVMVICGVTTYHFIQENSNLKARNAILHKVDMKYRFLKAASYIDLHKFKNTTDIVNTVNATYRDDRNYIDSVVYATEQAIREANEAAVLASEKAAYAKKMELETKKAKEEAERQNQKADSLKIKTAN